MDDDGFTLVQNRKKKHGSKAASTSRIEQRGRSRSIAPTKRTRSTNRWVRKDANYTNPGPQQTYNFNPVNREAQLKYNQVSAPLNKHTYFDSPCASPSVHQTYLAHCDVNLERETTPELIFEDNDLLEDEETVLNINAQEVHSTVLAADSLINRSDLNGRQILDTSAPNPHHSLLSTNHEERH